MKPFIIAATALLAFTPVANAGRVEPVEFAVEYCRLRERGVERQQAMRTAVAQTFDSDKKDVEVYLDGEMRSLDSVLSARAIALYCPRYLD